MTRYCYKIVVVVRWCGHGELRRCGDSVLVCEQNGVVQKDDF